MCVDFVMLYGACLLFVVVCVSCLHVFVCCDCDLLCDVVWSVVRTVLCLCASFFNHRCVCVFCV